MKKQQRTSRKSSKSKRQTQTASPAPDQSRRDLLKLARNGVIAVGVIGGGGAWAVSAVRATAYEQDLSRIGSGVPSIVQIHDPSCALCTALQREARKALKDFDEGEVEYVVANIKTEDGAAFAALHGQPHVTLMLMDPQGEPVQILNGPQNQDDLREIFTAHIEGFR